MTPHEIQENYFLLFQDSFMTALFPHRNWVMWVMLYYGFYSKALILAITTTASVLALMVDYCLARLLIRVIQDAKFFQPYTARYAKCVAFANRFAWTGVFIGFFDQMETAVALVAGALRVRLILPVAVGAAEGAVVGAAGAFKARIPVFLTAIIVGKVLYFTVMIYY